MPITSTKELKDYIDSNKNYLKRNAELFEIYEGDLLKHVKNIMINSVNEEYYERIKDRIYPINILRRVIDKIAQSYKVEPSRAASSHQDILEFYETVFDINEVMNTADEYAQMFKGYSLKPSIDDGVPILNIMPYDRFLPQGHSVKNRRKLTRFYEYAGKISRPSAVGGDSLQDIWFVYENESFAVIDEMGRLVNEFMVDPDTGESLDGTNPLGFIPVFYANRSKHKILPTQDTDILQLAKLLPVQITDLGGAILFQCFSIIFGIDVDVENAVMSPNAFWDLRSKAESDKEPKVGTIKPEVDVDKVLSFTKEVFMLWMETRGIRAGNVGNSSMQSVSGISKIIDEMDTVEATKRSIKCFVKEEREFWQNIKKHHNFWVTNNMLQGFPVLPDNWDVATEFQEPRPAIDREKEVNVAIKERDGGVISQETMISKLYPTWDESRIEFEIERMRGDF